MSSMSLSVSVLSVVWARWAHVLCTIKSHSRWMKWFRFSMLMHSFNDCTVIQGSGWINRSIGRYKWARICFRLPEYRDRFVLNYYKHLLFEVVFNCCCCWCFFFYSRSLRILSHSSTLAYDWQLTPHTYLISSQIYTMQRTRFCKWYTLQFFRILDSEFWNWCSCNGLFSLCVSIVYDFWMSPIFRLSPNACNFNNIC